jgi:hypothetical protein
MKGVSLPINSTAVLVLIIMFVALFFAMVSGVVNDEVDQFLKFSDDNSPDTVIGSSYQDQTETTAVRISYSQNLQIYRSYAPI